MAISFERGTPVNQLSNYAVGGLRRFRFPQFRGVHVLGSLPLFTLPLSLSLSLCPYLSLFLARASPPPPLCLSLSLAPSLSPSLSHSPSLSFSTKLQWFKRHPFATSRRCRGAAGVPRSLKTALLQDHHRTLGMVLL